jgi:hypothetical protein
MATEHTEKHSAAGAAATKLRRVQEPAYQNLSTTVHMLVNNREAVDSQSPGLAAFFAAYPGEVE